MSPEPDAAFSYVGSELELFAHARNWKRYLYTQIRPFLGPDVLEVGAGLGGTTQALCDGSARSWVCLEPDPQLAEQVERRIAAGQLPACCQVQVGTLEEMPADQRFDTLLYIDVLEHIEDDRAEAARAAARLRPGGRLVALGPAHPWLFSDFDRAIGHYRRYTRASLAALAPPGLNRVRLVYLDSVGLLASLGNALFLKQSRPTPAQIALWDSTFVRASRVLDPLLLRRVGKSVMAVWERPRV